MRFCYPKLMQPKPLKRVRFDALVKVCGAPEQVTLWAVPGPGSDFMRAVDQNRVATLVQHNKGNAKDFGIIGFKPMPSAAFLLFPKPLPHGIGTKIVGIKYGGLTERKAGSLYAWRPPSSLEQLRMLIKRRPRAGSQSRRRLNQRRGAQSRSYTLPTLIGAPVGKLRIQFTPPQRPTCLLYQKPRCFSALREGWSLSPGRESVLK